MKEVMFLAIGLGLGLYIAKLKGDVKLAQAGYGRPTQTAE